MCLDVFEKWLPTFFSFKATIEILLNLIATDWQLIPRHHSHHSWYNTKRPYVDQLFVKGYQAPRLPGTITTKCAMTRIPRTITAKCAMTRI